jgi:hypothetical protein
MSAVDEGTFGHECAASLTCAHMTATIAAIAAVVVATQVIIAEHGTEAPRDVTTA